MNFALNDEIILLKIGTDYYIQKVNAPYSPFQLYPGPTAVSPTSTDWVATAATSCDVDPADYIRDSAGVNYPKIIGQRPSSIVRR